MMSVSVVVPTYNERDNIEPLVKGIRAALSGHTFEILIVDDGSPDGTREAVRALHKSVFQLKLVEKKRREGIGAALRVGYDRARLGAIVSLDADLSFDPADIPRLLRPLEEGFDMVLGVRYGEGGVYETPNAQVRLKYWISACGNRFVRAVTGLPIRDVSANFRAIRRSVWERLETKDESKLNLAAELPRYFLRLLRHAIVYRRR